MYAHQSQPYHPSTEVGGSGTAHMDPSQSAYFARPNLHYMYPNPTTAQQQYPPMQQQQPQSISSIPFTSTTIASNNPALSPARIPNTTSTPAASPLGTSQLLLQRIRAQEESLRAMRNHSPIGNRASSPPNAAVSPVRSGAPAAAASRLPHGSPSTQGVYIPPLRFPNASHASSTASSARSIPLPQSNESATYFSQGGELALIMRVRLDSGVQELEVPYGVNPNSLAQAFSNRHGLKPAQTHLLSTAITSHLDLLEQYQSVAASQAATEASSFRERGSTDASLHQKVDAASSPIVAREASLPQEQIESQQGARGEQEKGEEESLEQQMSKMQASTQKMLDADRRHKMRSSANDSGDFDNNDEEEEEFEEVEEEVEVDDDDEDGANPSFHDDADAGSLERTRSDEEGVHTGGDDSFEDDGADLHEASQYSPPYSPSGSGGPTAGQLAKRRGRRMAKKPKTSYVFSPKHHEQLAAAPVIPPYTAVITPVKPVQRATSSIEIARSKSVSKAAPGAKSLAKHANFTPRILKQGGKGWKEISNSTESERFVLKGLKGTIDTDAIELKLKLKEIEKKRREQARAASAARKASDPSSFQSPVKGGGSHTETPAPSPQLEYGESFKQWQAEANALPLSPNTKHNESHVSLSTNDSSLPVTSKAVARKLEQVRSYAEFLKANPGVPFISLKSQALAAKRDDRLSRERSKEVTLEPHERLHFESEKLAQKRANLRKLQEEEARAKAKLMLFKVTGKSKLIVEESRASKGMRGGDDSARSSDSGRAKFDKHHQSASLRLYAEDQVRMEQRENKWAKRAAELEEERARAEAVHCTFKPQLSELAQQVRIAAPIWTRGRSNQMKAKKKEIYDKEMRRRQDEERKHLTFHPSINPVSLEIALAKRGELEGMGLPGQGVDLAGEIQMAMLMRDMEEAGVAASAGGSRGSSRSRSLSVSRSAHAGQQPISGQSSRTGSPSRRGRSVSPGGLNATALASSNRLYAEASMRRLRHAQLRAYQDEITQPFVPAKIAAPTSVELPSSPTARANATRRQLRALDFLSKHAAAAAAIASSVPESPQIAAQAALEWHTEKKRMEVVHKEQLKQIHQQFLNRTEEFSRKKQEYLERISSRFQSNLGTYKYDPTTHLYEFQPFFQPRLIAKQTGHAVNYNNQQVYTHTPMSSGSGRTMEEEKTPSGHSDDGSNRAPMNSPAYYSASKPELVSKASESLLQQRELQRIHYLFMLLDSAGVGLVDSSCRQLVVDIPSATDQKIVTSIFDRMDRHNSKLSASSSSELTSSNEEKQSSEPLSPIATANGVLHPSGSLTLPASPKWRLTIEAFTKMYQDGYKRLVRREGPQASAGLSSSRGSVANSRSASGATTPNPLGASRRGSLFGSPPGAGGSRSATQSREASVERRHSYLVAGSGAGGKGLSRRASLQVDPSLGADSSASMSPAGSSLAPSPGGTLSRRNSRFMSGDLSASPFRDASPGNLEYNAEHADFKPHISRKSEILAAKNQQALLAALSKDSGISHAISQPIAYEDGTGVLEPQSALQPHRLEVGTAALNLPTHRKSVLLPAPINTSSATATGSSSLLLTSSLASPTGAPMDTSHLSSHVRAPSFDYSPTSSQRSPNSAGVSPTRRLRQRALSMSVSPSSGSSASHSRRPSNVDSLQHLAQHFQTEAKQNQA